MNLIENMTLVELEADITKQRKRHASALSAIEKIHGKTDYSDEIAKQFHLGLVGFRKDRKRVNQSLNRAINDGIKATELYGIRDETKARLQSLYNAVNYICDNVIEDEKETATCRSIKERIRKERIETATTLKWEKINGHYGVAYQYGGFVVERVDAGFVALRDTAGNLVSHYKTVKEAKAAVSLAVSK